MKVIHIIMEGCYGGPQAFVSILAERLRRYDIESLVVIPKTNSNIFFQTLKQKNVPVKRLNLHIMRRSIIHSMKYVFSFIPEVVSLYKLIKNENADIVHCNHSWQIKGVLAARLAGKPVVWTIHESEMPAVINAIFKFVALRYCDTFIAVGEKVRSYYFHDKRFASKNISVIQSPVNTSVFDPRKVTEDHNIAKYQGVKIVTVCNINQIKGIEYFIEMASILNGQFKNLAFFIVGSTLPSQKKYARKLSNLVEQYKINNIHFYGQSENIPSVLKAADIYVCSSLSEASPISVWEAMSMARPIVSSDVGDITRFINNGENGFIVPIKDATALAEKVSLLIKDNDLRTSLGEKARHIAVRHLDADLCAEQYAALYKNVAQSQK